MIVVSEKQPEKVTEYENIYPYDQYRTYSEISVWRSFGGPEPYLDGAIEPAKTFVLHTGTPVNAFNFQWWSKRPPGDQEWRGGPGSIDDPQVDQNIRTYYGGPSAVGQYGRHYTSDPTYTDNFRNSDLTYRINTATLTYNLGQYLYITPNTRYGNLNYWEDYWHGSYYAPGQPTPPSHYERQKPATIEAKLIKAKLIVTGEVYGTNPTVGIWVGERLLGNKQGNLYSSYFADSPFYEGSLSGEKTINLTANFIKNNLTPEGDFIISFVDTDTVNNEFVCVPGNPTVGNRTVESIKQVGISAYLELQFMSPTYNYFQWIEVIDPLRLNQRDDQLGLSPTARLDLSPSTSYQKNNSSRISGGLYL
jgi:hypothetical protein